MMTSVPTIAFATLGCKTNQAESVRILSQLQWDLAVVPFEAGADVYVINTCTVTDEAQKQSRQLIRRAHRANPGAAIVVTGCAVDYATEDFEVLPGVRYVAPNGEKDRISEIVASWYGVTLGEERPASPNDPAVAAHVTTRAWLKVSEGCNNNCAFCVIPRVRGPEISVPAAELIARARAMARAGFKEVVLTGTNIGSYGRDGASGIAEVATHGAARGSTLAALVDRLIAAVPGIHRWRISSIEPIDFPPELMKVFSRPEVCPHVHLCLQSGSDAVLAKMRRRYNTGMYRSLVVALRAVRPDITITTDVIVGFPGEIEADFEATLSMMGEVGFAQVHLFPYSDREETHAKTLKNHLPRPLIAERMAKANGVASQLHQDWCQSWVGQEVEGLVERIGETHTNAVTPHFLKVRLASIGLRRSQIVQARVQGVEDGLVMAIVRGGRDSRIANLETGSCPEP